MRELNHRLVHLFAGEFFATIIFTSLYFYYFSFNRSLPLFYVLFILNFILLQGSFYWFVHWKWLKDRKSTSPKLFKFFSKLKKANLILISLVPFILITDTV